MATINLTPDAVKPTKVETSDLPAGFQLELGPAGDGTTGSVVLKGSGSSPYTGSPSYSVTSTNGTVVSGNINLTIAQGLTFDPANPSIEGWVGTPIDKQVATFSGDTITEFEVATPMPGLAVSYDNGTSTIKVAGTPEAVTAAGTIGVNIVSSRGGTAILTINAVIHAEEEDFEIGVGEALLFQVGSAGESLAASITGTTRAVSIEAVTDLPQGLSWVLDGEPEDPAQQVRLTGTPQTTLNGDNVTFRVTSASGKTAEASAALTVMPLETAFVESANDLVFKEAVAGDQVFGLVMNGLASTTVDPALPEGLSLTVTPTGNEPPTGVVPSEMAVVSVVGTPVAAAAAASYTVTFVPANGRPNFTATLRLEVGVGDLDFTNAGLKPWLLWPNTGRVAATVIRGTPTAVTAIDALPPGISLALNGQNIVLSGTATNGASLPIGPANYSIKVEAGEDSVTKDLVVDWIDGIVFANDSNLRHTVVKSEPDSISTIDISSRDKPGSAETVELVGAPAWISLRFNDPDSPELVYNPPAEGIANETEFDFTMRAVPGKGSPLGTEVGAFIDVKFYYVTAHIIPEWDKTEVEAQAEPNLDIPATVVATATNGQAIIMSWTDDEAPPGLVFAQRSGGVAEFSGKITAGTSPKVYTGSLRTWSRTGDNVSIPVSVAVVAAQSIVLDPASATVSVDVGQTVNQEIAQIKAAP